MLTAAGSGYSRWRDIAVTRWREDATRDCWGSYIFLRDTQTGHVWSAGYQPSGVEADDYEASFTEERAEIIRRDGDWSTTLEVVVSSEDDAEVRRISVTNLGTQRARDVASHLLRRAVPGLTSRRRGPSGLCEFVCPDGIRAGDRRAARHTPQAIG